jgi:hypothetical protein
LFDPDPRDAREMTLEEAGVILERPATLRFGAHPTPPRFDREPIRMET